MKPLWLAQPLGHAGTWFSRSPLADATDNARKFRLSVGGSMASVTMPDGLLSMLAASCQQLMTSINTGTTFWKQPTETLP